MPKQRWSRRRSLEAATGFTPKPLAAVTAAPAAPLTLLRPGTRSGIPGDTGRLRVRGREGGVGCRGRGGPSVGAVPRWLLLARGCGGARMLVRSLWQRGIKVTGTSVTAEYVPGGGWPRAPPPLLFVPTGAGFGAPTSAPLTPRLPRGTGDPPGPGYPGDPPQHPEMPHASDASVMSPRPRSHPCPADLERLWPRRGSKRHGRPPRPPPAPRSGPCPARTHPPGPPLPLIKVPPPRRSRGSRVAPKWV